MPRSLTTASGVVKSFVLVEDAPVRAGGSRHRSGRRDPRRHLLLALAPALLCACPGGGNPAAELRQPGDYPERPTGCVDTPFAGPDARSASAGVVCGRQRRTNAVALLRGRVVGEVQGGLPGPGLEGLWITVHVLDGATGQLPPARTEAQSGPQGSFTLSVAIVGDVVLAVRSELDGPMLTAKRVHVVAGENPDVILVVPAESPP